MLGRYVYLEFLIPFKDYIVTLKLREVIFDLCLPFIISIVFYFFVIRNGKYNDDIKEFNSHIIAFISVLIGFSIAAVTLLITSNNRNVEALQENYSGERRIGNRRISLYQLVLIIFTSALIVEFLTLLFNLGYFLVSSLNANFKNLWGVFYAINIFLIMHIIFLNIRNITNLYFVFLARNRSVNRGITNNPPNKP